jgi:hypothetical protein
MIDLYDAGFTTEVLSRYMSLIDSKNETETRLAALAHHTLALRERLKDAAAEVKRLEHLHKGADEHRNELILDLTDALVRAEAAEARAHDE